MGTIRRRKQYTQTWIKQINTISKDVILEKCLEYDVIYINHYIGKISNTTGTRIQFKCPRHIDKGIIDLPWSKFCRSAKGCPYCFGKNKTTLDFQKEINKNIKLLSDYCGLNSLVKCECLICGHVWETKAQNLKGNRGCPICRYTKSAIKHRKTQEQFEDELSQINPNLKIVGKYIGGHKKTQFKCLIHDCYFDAYPSNLLNKSSTCPECAKEHFSMVMTASNEMFIKKLQKNNIDIIPLEKYSGSMIPIKCFCLEHNIVYYAKPRDILRGKGKCPKCKDETISSGEKSIEETLKKYKLDYVYQKTYDDCVRINVLRFDFYVPSKNILIEYDGEQHYSPTFPLNGTILEKQKNFTLCQETDIIKTEYCKKNNIQLIRIPFWEKDNIEEIIKKRIVCV